MRVPELPVADLEQAVAQAGDSLRDAVYVVVGLGVLAFQRAQVERVQLQRQVEAYLESVREQSQSVGPDLLSGVGAKAAERLGTGAGATRVRITTAVRSLDGQVTPVRLQAEESIDRVEAMLPGQARELVRTLRWTAKHREQAVRSKVGLDPMEWPG